MSKRSANTTAAFVFLAAMPIASLCTLWTFVNEKTDAE